MQDQFPVCLLNAKSRFLIPPLAQTLLPQWINIKSVFSCSVPAKSKAKPAPSHISVKIFTMHTPWCSSFCLQANMQKPRNKRQLELASPQIYGPTFASILDCLNIYSGPRLFQLTTPSSAEPQILRDVEPNLGIPCDTTSHSPIIYASDEMGDAHLLLFGATIPPPTKATPLNGQCLSFSDSHKLTHILMHLVGELGSVVSEQHPEESSSTRKHSTNVTPLFTLF